MRVPPLLTLTTALPRDPQDFSGRFIAELVLALRAEGLEGRVLAPAGRRLAGVEVVHFPTLGGVLDAGGAPDALERSPLRAGLSGLATSAAIAAALRLHRRPHEALVSHWLVPNGLIAPEAIHYAHGGDVALLERLIASRRLARRLDQRARAMIFVSEDLRRRFNACLARPPRAPQRVLPMGVSPHQPDLFALARIKAAARGRPIVATVGRLVPIKGLDVLIEALRGLPSARWVAAGEGPLREALAARARAAGVEAVFMGALAPPQRDALLAAASAFVLPSRRVGQRSEGTPVSLLEALHRGVPSIATDTGGVGALAVEAGLTLIPPEDAGALRAALRQVLSSPEQAARMSARHVKAAARFSWDALGPLHAQAIGEALMRRA